MHLLPKDIGKSDPLPVGNIFLTLWERKHHLLPTPYSSSGFPRRKEIGSSPSFLPVPAQIYFSFLFFFFLVRNPVCKFMVNMFSFLLDVFLGVDLLDHTVTLCLTFWEMTVWTIYIIWIISLCHQYMVLHLLSLYVNPFMMSLTI